MISLSVSMIVKNESEVLARCLDSIQEIADEIIIVDTGSTDDTIDIAKKYTDKVYTFQWIDDFAAARNYSLSKATKDYVMWLDADDIILASDREKIIKLKNEIDPQINCVYMFYNTGINNNGKPSLSYLRERLLKRDDNLVWQEPVHEHLSYIGASMKYDAAITHGSKTRSSDISTRNLDIYENQIKKGNKLSARAQYYFARELKTHGMNERAIEMYRTFLKNNAAWSEDKITSCLDLAVLYEQNGDFESMIEILLHSLSFSLPRQDICCRIGDYMRYKFLFKEAIFWYKTAIELPKPDGMGFVYEDYLGFIPNIWLSVCYDKIREYETAKMHNDIAKLYKPNHPSVIRNSEYFDEILK